MSERDEQVMRSVAASNEAQPFLTQWGPKMVMASQQALSRISTREQALADPVQQKLLLYQSIQRNSAAAATSTQPQYIAQGFRTTGDSHNAAAMNTVPTPQDISATYGWQPSYGGGGGGGVQHHRPYYSDGGSGVYTTPGAGVNGVGAGGYLASGAYASDAKAVGYQPVVNHQQAGGPGLMDSAGYKNYVMASGTEYTGAGLVKQLPPQPSLILPDVPTDQLCLGDMGLKPSRLL
jgi:hypothetical protein